jgi:hypothetical protein
MCAYSKAVYLSSGFTELVARFAVAKGDSLEKSG